VGREAVDDLRGDMAHHQRVTGAEVTDSRNHAMAADLVERLERQESPAPVPSDVEPPAPRIGTEVREGQHGKYTLATGRDDIAVRKASEGEKWFLEHAVPRVNLLLEKKDTGPLGQPSWHQRVWAVMQLRRQANDLAHSGFHAESADLTRRFGLELFVLLEESIKPFGDWKADKPRLVMVG
jgi:hypothetical protein